MNIDQAIEYLFTHNGFFDVGDSINPLIGFSFNKKDGFFFIDLRFDCKNQRYSIFITGGHAFQQKRFNLRINSKNKEKLLDDLPMRFKGIDYDIRDTNLEFLKYFDSNASVEHNLYHFFPQLPDPYNERTSSEKFTLQAKQLITNLNHETSIEFKNKSLGCFF